MPLNIMSIFSDYHPIFRWVCLWILLSGGISAQSAADLLDDLGLSPDLVVSEDDLDHLSALAWLPSDTISGPYISHMTSLSFISGDSQDFLLSLKADLPRDSVLRRPDLPDDVRVFLAWQPGHKEPVPVSGRLVQRVSGPANTRIYWKGQWTMEHSVAGFALTPNGTSQSMVKSGAFYLAGNRESWTWVAGDFQLATGYGMLFWKPFPAYKGFETISSYPRIGTGLQPFRSTTPDWSLRGLAVRRAGSTIDLTLGISRRALGSDFIPSGDLNVGESHPVQETLGIGILQWTGTAHTIGIATAVSDYSGSGPPRPILRGSVFGRMTFPTARLFGEITGTGGVAGFQLRFGRIQYLGALRALHQPFSGARPNPVSEWSSRSRDENGVFQGLYFNLGSRRLWVYGDLFRQSGRPMKLVFPSLGRESGIRWEFTKTGSRLRLQWKQKRGLAYHNPDYYPIPQEPDNIRSTASATYYYTFGSGFKTRLQLTRVRSQQSDRKATGIGGMANIYLTVKSVKLAASVLAGQVEDFTARLYFWDLNLPDEMRSVMLSKSGYSAAIRGQVHFLSRAEIGLRIRWMFDRQLSDRPATAAVALILVAAI